MIAALYGTYGSEDNWKNLTVQVECNFQIFGFISYHIDVMQLHQ
jgi:hypothetical protein